MLHFGFETALLNDKAVSFSRLKLFSGGMAVGATWIGAFFDYMDFGAESSRGRSTLASLYLLKSAVGFGLGVVTFSASATFAPNIARRILLYRVSASTIEQFSKKASKLLLARLVGATVGTWITAGLMVTQALIIALDDDALEKWCKNSPFGLEAAGENAFKDAEKMHQSLEAAIYDVK